MENIKQAKKKQKIEKILEESASSVLLFYSAFIFIILFYYGFIANKIPVFFTLLFIGLSAFWLYFNYYKRKIIITKNKFYIYRLGKKSVSLNFSSDFLHIKFEKSRLGKIFNYGTLLLVDQKNQFYKIDFINNPEQVFYTTIETYEDVMVKINTDYERKYIKTNSEHDKKINFEKV